MKKLWLLILPFIFIACEDEDINDFNKARACLDASTAATAQSCVSPIASDTSPAAYRLRCAAYFLEQDLDTAELAEIFSSIQGSTASEFDTFSNALVFSSPSGSADALSKANAMKTNCLASESSGMIMFASVAHSATLLISTTGWDGTEANIDANYSGFTGINDDAIGENVLQIQATFCSDGAGQADLCNQINTIIDSAASSSASDIGTAFRTYID